ncbi:MAG: aspartate/glutamate racemase family protein, partial [Ornithinimicrobium sp.]
MRLLAITPIHVDDHELARRQQRYDRLCPPGVSVDLRDVGSGPEVPRALESDDDVRASEVFVRAALDQLDLDGFDAVLPDCVLDPMADSTDLPLPVFGIGRLAAHHLCGFGGRVGAVARNGAIARELDRRLAGYGVAAEPTEVLDLTVADIADDAAWAAAVQE